MSYYKFEVGQKFIDGGIAIIVTKIDTVMGRVHYIEPIYSNRDMSSYIERLDNQLRRGDIHRCPNQLKKEERIEKLKSLGV
jgi:hypothetical protein